MYFFNEPFDKKYRIKRMRQNVWAEEGIEIETDYDSNSSFLGLGLSKKKLNAVVVFIFILLSFLLGKTAYLQIAKGEYYTALSEGNRIRVQKILPKRGIIYDRNGKQLVRNVPSFSISLIPIDLPREKVLRVEILAELSSTLNIPLATIEETLKKVSSFYPNPITIAENIPYEDALLLKIKSVSMPGVLFDIHYQREYLSLSNTKYESATSLSHILGYIGTITENELSSVEEGQYLLNDKIGKTGIENTYESILLGRMGEKQVDVDAVGK